MNACLSLIYSYVPYEALHIFHLAFNSDLFLVPWCSVLRDDQYVCNVTRRCMSHWGPFRRWLAPTSATVIWLSLSGPL